MEHRENLDLHTKKGQSRGHQKKAIMGAPLKTTREVKHSPQE